MSCAAIVEGGLKRSHSSTMTKTHQSRKQLRELFKAQKTTLESKVGHTGCDTSIISSVSDISDKDAKDGDKENGTQPCNDVTLM